MTQFSEVVYLLHGLKRRVKCLSARYPVLNSARCTSERLDIHSNIHNGLTALEKQVSCVAVHLSRVICKAYLQ